MVYAEVAVGVRSAPGRTFSYSVPEGLDVLRGHAVQVPFGPRQLPGFVFEVAEVPSYTETRDISAVIDSEPWLSPDQVEIARWTSETYQSSLYAAASLMIPPGYRQRIIAIYRLAEAPPATSVGSMDERQRQLYAYVQRHGEASQTDVQKRFGKRAAEVALGQLVRKRLVSKRWHWLEPRVRPKYVLQASLAIGPEAAREEAQRLSASRAKKQGALLGAIAGAAPSAVRVADLAREFGSSSRPALNALEKQGLVSTRRERVERDPLAGRTFSFAPPLELTGDQKKAWAGLGARLDSAGSGPGSSKNVFLLHGVTSSGKTELYLMALERAVANGKRGLVLVPEIALTPQTIERFAGRFPGRVAVLHSRLSAGQYFDEWWRVRKGQFDVVIGSRGAVFAPQPDLGLIVLDEEQEFTYKQSDSQPLYHARDVALKRAELSGAVVILGSATPQIESYHRAVSGEFTLLELPHRVPVSANGASAPMPRVHLVDMREELKLGTRGVFSRALREGIRSALRKSEQIILFLNRRGAATFVQCRDCGHVARCARCSAVMTYHAERVLMRCHQCSVQTAAPTKCPDCWGPNIRYMGLGTERLELEVVKAFPQAETLRWDSDVTGSADTHEHILRAFREHKADILIGTQMIAKGLHLPGVTLVGVVNADIGLHTPDFRAAERVFDVLCQVAGRSGRGGAAGRVIIQTYSPQHYAVSSAAIQDYRAFYDQEIGLRMERALPPFGRLTRLVFNHPNFAAARREAERMHGALQEQLEAWAFPGTRIIGPAPAPIERVRGRYRWHVMIHGPEPSLVLNKLNIPEGWIVDVDPVNLM